MLTIGSILGRVAKLSIGSVSSTAVPATSAQIQTIRPATFLVRLGAEDLWKSVTSVSNAGRKRGRASGHSKKASKDLNRGQVQKLT